MNFPPRFPNTKPIVPASCIGALVRKWAAPVTCAYPVCESKTTAWVFVGRRMGGGQLSFDHTGTSDAAVAVAISFFKRGVGAAYGEPRDCGVTLEFVEGHIRTILPELLTTTYTRGD